MYVFADGTFNNLFAFHIFSEIHNIKTVILKQKLHNIFSYIVNIAVNGGKQNFIFSAFCLL